ncbi:aminobenzoyl-glutamate utilization protein B [Dongia mobilis]|uniref:Aminobenzoyl-glutamate utilization protein B n=1 Tax=Dongia mobilis TaxID=578943 RepID=A0A4R6WIV6_9PROT|nr:amidohydrolase [Dongia mobilis]TDQ78430.1 aminobenzoyl-glutamate utilization protein B [Dongia mobilis]
MKADDEHKLKETADAARRHWLAIRPQIERQFQALWQLAELPNMEFRSATILADWLEEHGFTVSRHVCGIPTAFTASYRHGDGPCIALLAEYDALPGTGNMAVPRREATGLPGGHACGHNHIGPANIGAAIAAAHAMAETGIDGHILVIGCPSEEIVWGKIALLREGAFDQADAILTSHGDYQNGAVSRPCQSVVSGEFVFLGESGHGGTVRRQNALDAAELAIQSVERLRAHHFPDTAAEHVMRLGGRIPNVTPDEARVWMTTRQVDFERAEAVYQFIRGISDKAATMCGVGFREQFITATRGYLANDTLAELLQRRMDEIGPPRWSDADLAWMQELVHAIRPGERMKLDRDTRLHRVGHDLYGQDDGEASWRIPLGRVNWAVPEQVPLHNWSFAALSGHTASHAGPLMASEVLTLGTLDLIQSPATVAQAKAELARRIAGRTIGEPRIGAWHTMTEAPDSFWDATWVES